LLIIACGEAVSFAIELGVTDGTSCMFVCAVGQVTRVQTRMFHSVATNLTNISKEYIDG
jgi:hypothetical protein